MSLRFEWDGWKADANLEKHGVSFDEAASVFRDPLAAIFDDPEHSIGDPREIIIGHSILGRLLMVAFTERGRDTLRIISARPATRMERKDYEQNAARTTSTRKSSDTLRSEYRLDYSKAKPNRFAMRAEKGSVVVVLDEDIARVFRTPESVKAVLRALITTMPETTHGKRSRLHAKS